MAIAVIIAGVFIGLYFNRSANNIGKNGLLWTGIALGTFLSLSALVSLVSYFLFVSLLKYSDSSSFLLAGLVGMGAGILGLFVVNHYLNIIPD